MSAKPQRSLFQGGTLLIISFILIVLAGGCWIFSSSTFDQPQPKAGIVLLGGIDEEGWNAPQYRGICRACDKMHIELLTKDYLADGATPNQQKQAVTYLKQHHADIITLYQEAAELASGHT